MIKEAIEKILSIAENKTYEINGQTYSDHELNLVEPIIDRPRVHEVGGLDSLVKLIRTELHRVTTPLFVQVDGPTTVNVFTTYREDYTRDKLYSASISLPRIDTEHYLSRDAAMIMLRSKFSPNDGVNYLLDLLSKIVKDDTSTTNDNGMTQSVTIRQGVQLKAKETVKPRVSLCPFRTFLEVNQPESEFLVRLDDDCNIGFWEADGGMWKITAKQNICDYFETELKDLIGANKVIIMR